MDNLPNRPGRLVCRLGGSGRAGHVLFDILPALKVRGLSRIYVIISVIVGVVALAVFVE